MESSNWQRNYSFYFVQFAQMTLLYSSIIKLWGKYFPSYDRNCKLQWYVTIAWIYKENFFI